MEAQPDVEDPGGNTCTGRSWVMPASEAFRVMSTKDDPRLARQLSDVAIPGSLIEPHSTCGNAGCRFTAGCSRPSSRSFVWG